MEKFYVVKLSKSLLERLLAQVNLFGFIDLYFLFLHQILKLSSVEGIASVLTKVIK